MLHSIQHKFIGELSADETLIWCGQPKGGFRWEEEDVIRIPFFLLWLIIAVIITYPVFTSEFVPFFAKLISLVFLCVGIWLNSYKLVDKLIRQHTYYAITNKNIIVINELYRRSVRKFSLKTPGIVRLFPFDDLRGTIIFEPSGREVDGEPLRLDSILNAGGVYRQLAEAVRNLPAAQVETSFPDLDLMSPENQVLGILNIYKYFTMGLLLVFIGFIAWNIAFSVIPSLMADKSDPDRKTVARDPCADWRQGVRAEELVMAERKKYPHYAELSAQEAHQKGLEHDKRGEFAIAVWAWECEVAKNPNSLDGWNDIGYAYQRLENPELALKNANKSIDINPNFGHGHYTAGRALLIMGRYSEAKDELQKAIRNGWQHGGDSEMLLGLALRGLGEETEAVEAFRRSLKIRPNYEQTERYLAGEHYQPVWPMCKEQI
ncbi:MAG: tetratricopeptide repeat protein [Ignavibacteriales bacterium]